jgi:putative ABC transport system permease protein
MFRATVKSLLSRKLRLLLSGLAVVIGVMAVSAALFTTDSLGRSFDSLFQTIDRNLDVQVVRTPRVASAQTGPPQPQPVPADVLARVAAVQGVRTASGSVAVNGARVIGTNGKVIVSQGPPRLGLGWSDGGGLAVLRQGRGPKAPDEVAINAALAKQGGFKVGGPISVLTLQPKRTFTVTGIFGYAGGRDSLGGETSVAFTEPVAQELMLGSTGVYSSINVTAADGVSPAQLRDRVRAAVGDGYTVQTGQQVADAASASLKGFLDVIRNFLLGFAGVTLFVGIFLIVNTFSILVAQRTRELALYRALGASRGQVLRSVLVEATLIGLVASTLGLLAGYGLSLLLRKLFETVGSTDLPGAGIAVSLAPIAAGYLVGTIVTIVAALLPALRASRIAPVAAMRDAATPDRPLTVLTVAGAIPTALGVAAVATALFRDLGDLRLWTLIAGVLLVFVGVAMLTPAISRPMVSVLGQTLSWSMPGKLGRRNSARNPRRTAITAATLMIGIALVTGVSVIGSSLKASIEQLTRQSLRAQLIISGDSSSGALPTYDPAIIDRVQRIPGVRRAVAVYGDEAQVGSQVMFVGAADGAALADAFSLQATAGELSTLRSGEILVDDEFAKTQKLSVGSTLGITTQRAGRLTVTVVGIYRKSQLLPGGPLLSVADATAGFSSRQPFQGYVMLDSGADAAAIQRQVDVLLKDNPEVSVQNQSSFVQQTASQVNTVQGILYVLLALAIVIAVLGIVNTLALSILERTRELGLLRAVGMRRRQVAQMVTVESVVISMFGALLGLVLGCALGAAVVEALKDQGIPVLSFPTVTILVFLALSVIVGLIAAIVPAVRASRIDVLRAISYE